MKSVPENGNLGILKIPYKVFMAQWIGAVSIGCLERQYETKQLRNDTALESSLLAMLVNLQKDPQLQKLGDCS